MRAGELSWLRKRLDEALDRLEGRLEAIEGEIETLSKELRELHPKHAVIAKYVRCGKPNCHCAQPGDPGHGPYFYLRYKQGGKLVEEYLGTKPPEVEGEGEGAIPAGEYRRLQARLRRLRRERERLLNTAADVLRQLSSLIGENTASPG